MAVDHKAFARAAAKRQRLAKTLRVEPDRFNHGEFVVKDERGSVVASSFETCDEAQAWINSKKG